MFFRGSRYESRRCPLSVVNRTPGVHTVISLYHHTDGRLGTEVLRSSALLVEAFACIDEGRAHVPAKGAA